VRPVLKIMREFDPSPERIKSDFDRLLNGLFAYADSLAVLGEVKPEVPSRIVRTGVCAASYDVLLRVSPVPDAVVTVQFPQPKTTDGGRILRVARLGYDGYVVLSPLGSSLINGRSQLNMFSTPGMAEIRFDGTDFYSSYQGAVAWGEDL